MELIVLLSGKAGSGKTTVANMLVGSTKNIDYIPFSEKYYETKHGRSFAKLKDVFEKSVGIATVNKTTIAVSNWRRDRDGITVQAIELSEPLKQLTNTMTTIPYEILLGEGVNREKRDEHCYYSTITDSHITGRELLVAFGTEGFRKMVDEDYWVKLAVANLGKPSHATERGMDSPIVDLAKLNGVKSITVVSDVRFANEIDTFRKMEETGTANSSTRVIHIIIARELSELSDYSGHVSEWEYLYRKENANVIINDGSLSDLAEAITKALN